MYAWFYKGSHLLDLPIFSMALFMAVFALAVVRVMRPRNRARTDELSRLPLNEAQEHHTGGNNV